MNVSEEYLAGYITADCHVAYKGVSCNFECIDKDLLINITGKAKHRFKTVKGKVYGTYTSHLNLRQFGFYKEDSLKDYRDYYYSLDDEGKDRFVHGYLDGDGSLCYYPSFEGIRIIFYTSREPEEEIIREWLSRKGFKRVYTHVDRRGHPVVMFELSHIVEVAPALNDLFRDGVYNLRKFIPVLRYIKAMGGIRSLDDKMAGYCTIRGYLSKEVAVVNDKKNPLKGIYKGKWCKSDDFYVGVLSACKYFRSDGIAFTYSKSRDYSIFTDRLPFDRRDTTFCVIKYKDIKNSGIPYLSLDKKLVERINNA